VKDESSRFIGTVLEYEAPFEAIKNITTVATESKTTDSGNESNNEKSQKVSLIINTLLLIYPFDNIY